MAIAGESPRKMPDKADPVTAWIIRRADLRTAPWKNGSGLTREIWSVTQGDTLLWRISLADVTSDGPFSAFAGMTRILTVVQGAGMDLHGPDRVLAADPYSPVCFDGALPLEGRLRDGKVVNFNLIHHANDIAAQVSILHAPARVKALIPGACHVLHVVTGKGAVDGTGTCGPGDTVVCPATGPLPDISATGICIIVALVDQREANSPVIAPL